MSGTPEKAVSPPGTLILQHNVLSSHEIPRRIQQPSSIGRPRPPETTSTRRRLCSRWLHPEQRWLPPFLFCPTFAHLGTFIQHMYCFWTKWFHFLALCLVIVFHSAAAETWNASAACTIQGVGSKQVESVARNSKHTQSIHSIHISNIYLPWPRVCTEYVCTTMYICKGDHPGSRRLFVDRSSAMHASNRAALRQAMEHPITINKM